MPYIVLIVIIRIGADKMDTKENFSPDLHIHSFFSYDGNEKTETYIKKAVERGDKIIGFSEHYDFDCRLLGDTTPLCDIEKYHSEILRLRDKYARKIEILFGIEFGYDRKACAHYAELVQKYNFDYVINSVHLINGKDCCRSECWENKTEKELYVKYFEKVFQSIDAVYPWQIVGHLGYPCRYAPSGMREIPYVNYKEFYDEILKKIIQNGKVLEINTSTKGNVLCLPNIEVLRRYKELGGKYVTFGSDAHSIERYREKENKIREIIENSGFSEVFFRKGCLCEI